MAVVLKSEPTWGANEPEAEMMEVGGLPRDQPNRNLLVRTSFVDALTAYTQVCKNKASGKKKTLWLRLVMQMYMFQLGNFIQMHCGKVVFLGLVVLSMCCLGLKTSTMENDVEHLWVDAGSRLARELKYTEDALGLNGGYLNEVIIQVSSQEGQNILTVDNLLLHLEALRAVTNVNVDMFGITWKFQDLCHIISFPDFNDRIDSTFQALEPCMIISPLECFWEGSILLGPEKQVKIPGYGLVDWTNLNPDSVVEELKRNKVIPVMEKIKEMLDKVGMNTAYQEKPCLDPNDPRCPETAPNFASKELPDVVSVLTNGCDGFASKFIHWPEDIILGGIKRDKSGDLIKVEALQSTIPVVGQKVLYDIFKDTKIVYELSTAWNESAAAEVIRAWERQMTLDVRKSVVNHVERITGQRQSKAKSKIHSFSSRNLKDLLEGSSQVSYIRILLGFLLMACYSCLVVANIKKCEESQAGVALAGLLLLALSSAAGLGLCSLLHLSFNAVTTQAVPFLVVGFGIDHVFVILHSFSQSSQDGAPYKERSGCTLKRVGALILSSSVCNSSGFLLASVIPVPATRFFCLQCCLLILVNMVSALLVFPAMVNIDLLRRKSGRMDFFCCQLRPSVTTPPVSYTKSPSKNSKLKSDPRHLKRKRSSCDDDFGIFSPFNVKPSSSELGSNKAGRAPERGSFGRESPSDQSSGFCSSASSQELFSASPTTLSPATSTSSSLMRASNTDETTNREAMCSVLTGCILSEFIKRFYGPFLGRLPVKIIVIIFFITTITLGVVGVLQVREGLELMDVLPVSSPEREFMRVQSKYFGTYNFYIATQDNFDYASERGQLLLHDLHQSFRSVTNIIRTKDGNLPEFWLELFRNWLLEVQDAFDEDKKNGAILKKGWLSNSSSLGQLGYRLIIQTGIRSNPLDKNRFDSGRLVHNGIIYSPAFYTYLSAWAHNDGFLYEFSEASIKPNPKEWKYDDADKDLSIPESLPITFAQIAYVISNLHSTEAMMDTLSSVRNICDSFVSQGLPNYPHGVVIMHWEQYFSVRFYLAILIISVFVVVYIIVLIVLLNPFSAFLEVFVLACTMVELYGFMGWMAIKMSALSAAVLISAVGATVHITLPFALAFQTSIGPRDRRMMLSLEQTVTPTTHTFLAAFLALLVLATSELVFIVKYVFGPLAVMLSLGYFNGLVFFPVLLSLVGPSAEVTPHNGELYLPPPSPVVQSRVTASSRSRSSQKVTYKTKKKRRRSFGSRSRSGPPPGLRIQPNLSTIVEESSNNSCSSSISIDLKPTIIISNPTHCCGGAPTTLSLMLSSPSMDGAETSSEEFSPNSSRTTHSSSKNFHLHTSASSISASSPPVQISSCSSSRCITTVEATTKVKVHIHDQKDKQPKYPLKQKSSSRREASSGVFRPPEKRARH